MKSKCLIVEKFLSTNKHAFFLEFLKINSLKEWFIHDILLECG